MAAFVHAQHWEIASGHFKTPTPINTIGNNIAAGVLGAHLGGVHLVNPLSGSVLLQSNLAECSQPSGSASSATFLAVCRTVTGEVGLFAFLSTGTNLVPRFPMVSLAAYFQGSNAAMPLSFVRAFFVGGEHYFSLPTRLVRFSETTTFRWALRENCGGANDAIAFGVANGLFVRCSSSPSSLTSFYRENGAQLWQRALAYPVTAIVLEPVYFRVAVAYGAGQFYAVFDYQNNVIFNGYVSSSPTISNLVTDATEYSYRFYAATQSEFLWVYFASDSLVLERSVTLPFSLPSSSEAVWGLVTYSTTHVVLVPLSTSRSVPLQEGCRAIAVNLVTGQCTVSTIHASFGCSDVPLLLGYERAAFPLFQGVLAGRAFLLQPTSSPTTAAPSLHSIAPSSTLWPTPPTFPTAAPTAFYERQETKWALLGLFGLFCLCAIACGYGQRKCRERKERKGLEFQPLLPS